MIDRYFCNEVPIFFCYNLDTIRFFIMRDDMRNIDITTNINTILIILWVLLPKLWRIWKKKDIFKIYDIPFDLLPIFVLSNGWMRFGILLIIYVVFMLVLTLIFSKGKVILFNEKQSSQNNDTNNIS